LFFVVDCVNVDYVNVDVNVDVDVVWVESIAIFFEYIVLQWVGCCVGIVL